MLLLTFQWVTRVSRLRGCLCPGQVQGADFPVGPLVRYFGLVLGSDQDARSVMIMSR